ncbi:MAG: hypothetical protein ACK4XN_07280 [Dolichospermum sp.]
MDFLKRREVLVNLISRVGRGQQNIYRWVDELIDIDAQLEHQEQVQEETKVTTELKLAVGMQIVHPRWGEGTVFAVMGKMISVDFPGMGRKLVSDTSDLKVDKLQNKPQVQPQVQSQAPIKSQPFLKVDTSLEKAKQQLLALGVLEESILIQDGLVVVLGADCQKHENQFYYWDKTVFPTEHDKGYKKDAGNVRINPAQVKNSQRKAWEDYKTKQGKKPSQPFEKWLSGRLVNLPELVVSKIDAKPASIWIKKELYCYVLVINRASRHVQELSAAIRHEMNGKDYQDDKFMVFLNNQETVTLATREEWKLKTHFDLLKMEGRPEKEFYVKDEVFSPIMEKLNLAAKKCGDSFEMPFGLRVM